VSVAVTVAVLTIAASIGMTLIAPTGFGRSLGLEAGGIRARKRQRPNLIFKLIRDPDAHVHQSMLKSLAFLVLIKQTGELKLGHVENSTVEGVVVVAPGTRPHRSHFDTESYIFGPGARRSHRLELHKKGCFTRPLGVVRRPTVTVEHIVSQYLRMYVLRV
jgi:hypothetical protein